jgi:hypothetical protein
LGVPKAGDQLPLLVVPVVMVMLLF